MTLPPESDDDFIYIALERVACPRFLNQLAGCTAGQDKCWCYAAAKSMLGVMRGQSPDEHGPRNVQ